MSEEERQRGVEEPGSMGPCGVKVRPRNWLAAVILVTLREQSSYGYELLERMTAFGFEEMNPGTLYRTLRQMEKEGLCESTWETSRGGPARRMYSITEAGEAHLDNFWVKSLEQYQQMMEAFFRLYSNRPSRAEESKGDE